jgi:hypothetical protein
MDPNARVRRNRGGLSESRATGQQGQDSSGRKDSTDFHCNVPSGPKPIVALHATMAVLSSRMSLI